MSETPNEDEEGVSPDPVPAVEPEAATEPDTPSGAAVEAEPALPDAGAAEGDRGADGALASTVEALLFLSTDPLGVTELSEACQAGEEQIADALQVLAERHCAPASGLRLKEVGGGFTLASAPESEDAARRLFSKPRVATLTPAQTETLAIVAYLQPISRPEIGRIRGVSADSATAALLERGLIEEAGRSQFGAALYRTTTLFLKLFGLKGLDELPEVSQWDPTPEEQQELRERLLRAGDARSGGGPSEE